MKRVMFLLTFIVFIIALSLLAYAEPIVTDGLVSHWTFDRDDIIDKTVKDVWGENDATIMGNPKSVGGIVGRAIKLDGSGDFVNLTNLGDFGSKIHSSTFEAWVKTSDKEDWTTLFKVIDPVGLKCYTVWGMDINRTLKIERDDAWHLNPAERDPLDRWGWDSYPFKDGNVLIYFAHKSGAHGCRATAGGWPFQTSDGEWHHLVYVKGAPYEDEAGEMWRETAIAMDGRWQWKTRSKGSVNPGNFVSFTEPVYLGAGNNRGKAEGFFKGLIDEVRIYNRPLTQEEVIRNYEAGNPLSVEPAQKLPTVWGALKARR
ncbi:MAG: hypothetical protein OXU23_09490 [Candidatus Poribacteria bacterium]|nr:hypothetical protein [Candidatus Poribacteria bacterium]